MKKILIFTNIISIFLLAILFFRLKENDNSFETINEFIQEDQQFLFLSKNAHRENTDIENIDLFKSKIDEYLTKYDTQVSFYFRDLNNGPWFTYNSQARFAGASLLKIPTLIAFLAEEDRNPGFLDRKVLYDKKPPDNYVDLNLEFNHSLSFGNSYSVEELLNYMIIESDNIALFLLENLAEEIYLTPNIFETRENLGLNRLGDYITVAQYSTLLRLLFNAEYLSLEMSDKALEIMSKSTYEKALTKYLPKRLEVAHKYGTRWFSDSDEKQLHDCGIFYKQERPYILCVMTRGTDVKKQEEIIANISKKAYELLNN